MGYLCPSCTPFGWTTTRRTSILPDPPSTFSVENTLAKALLNLSFDDRTEIEEELHGVKCRAATETPELIKKSLTEFDSQLNERKESDPTLKVLRNVIRISGEPNDSKETTSPKSSCYLNDPNVRIRFLRCELFDVDKAVQRFINHWDFMSLLFGDFIADRPPLLSDFEKEVEIALMNSRCQCLPYRDRSGRRILTSVGNCNYVFDEGSESSWEKILRLKMPKEAKENQVKQHSSLPTRVTSWQQYYKDTPYFRFLSSLYVYSMDMRYRSVFKVHFGEQTEILYKISSYGINVDLIPISCTGTLKFNNHIAWLNVIKAKMNPKAIRRKDIVECPGSCDVIFRKGGTSKFNIGNAYYRDLIEIHSSEHLKGEKNTKFEITMLIIKKIESRGGRFLEWINSRSMWVVFSERDKVRKKIASAMKQFNRSKPSESK